eukprot:3181497-Prymnesium_polylepis.1
MKALYSLYGVNEGLPASTASPLGQGDVSRSRDACRFAAATRRKSQRAKGQNPHAPMRRTQSVCGVSYSRTVLICIWLLAVSGDWRVCVNSTLPPLHDGQTWSRVYIRS